MKRRFKKIEAFNHVMIVGIILLVHQRALYSNSPRRV